MKVAIGGDHAGFVFKNDLVSYIRRRGFEVLDLGAHAYNEKDDYPDFAFAVARAVIAGEAERGIVGAAAASGRRWRPTKYWERARRFATTRIPRARASSTMI
jgi:ribose 5-phosphate isomerase B